MRLGFRFLASALALGWLLAAAAHGAAARPQWCKKDPIVQIGGQTAQIVVSSYAAMNESATGPVEVVVTVPLGTGAQLRATDAGFGGQGYLVRFVEADAPADAAGGLPVRIEVYAPAADGSLPVLVEFVPLGVGGLAAGSASGVANSWVVLVTP